MAGQEQGKQLTSLLTLRRYFLTESLQRAIFPTTSENSGGAANPNVLPFISGIPASASSSKAGAVSECEIRRCGPPGLAATSL